MTRMEHFLFHKVPDLCNLGPSKTSFIRLPQTDFGARFPSHDQGEVGMYVFQKLNGKLKKYFGTT